MSECTCFEVDSKYWTTHYGAVEPGSMHEPNPECPEHFPTCEVCNGKADWGSWDMPEYAVPIFCKGCGGLVGVDCE